MSTNINVRLGPELMERVQAFKTEGGLDTISAASRALIMLGLERSAALDVTWRKIAFREGVKQGEAAIKGAFAEAIVKVGIR